MEDTLAEVVVANLVFVASWISTVAVIRIAGQRRRRMKTLRDKMIAQWRPLWGYVYARQSTKNAVDLAIQKP